MREEPGLRGVPDDELLRRLTDLTRESRRVEADLVAHIGEVDARRLYMRRAASSMFVYCTKVLHLSEAEAWLRILVARASREHPMLLTMLRDGRLHLSGIRRLAPHLTRANRGALLKRAVHKSRRQIEELVAEVAPRPDAPAGIRRLPAPRGPSSSPTGPARGANGPFAADEAAASVAGAAEVGAPIPAGAPEAPLAGPGGNGHCAISDPQLGPDPVGDRPTVARPRQAQVEPLAPERYRVQFTASAGLRAKLEHLQALMRTSVPDGDLATLVEVAVTEKIERLEAQRFGRVKTPRKTVAETDTTPSSRRVPAAVRRTVHERDGGRCTYVDVRGTRCTARERLEFHHRKPFGLGGDHSPANIALACRAHNTLMAECDYGKEKMARHRRSGRSDRSADQVPELTTPSGRDDRQGSRLRRRASGPSP